ncbi:MAG: DUF853 family protein, partial [Myxococcales bacterium]|nr:DUF853 family protein [Myxococcales bacterium]
HWVALCDGNAVGGKLLKELLDAKQQAAGQRLVIARSSGFPKSSQGKTNRLMKQLILEGGQRTIIQDVEWRKMAALKTFKKVHSGRELETFLLQQRPSLHLQCIREILDLDGFTRKKERSPRVNKPSLPTPPPLTPPNIPGPEETSLTDQEATLTDQKDPSLPDRVEVGILSSRQQQPAYLDISQLKRHAAFMGASGSGKTTLALRIIEQLLAQGIPAVLLDRKGDLAGYRKPGVWGQKVDFPGSVTQHELPLDNILVTLYTPGHSDGRLANLPLLPADAHLLTDHERSLAAKVASESLTGMMKYGNSQKAKGKEAVLMRALSYLMQEPQAISAYDLLDFIKEQDADFVTELGAMAKFLVELSLDLEILLSTHSTLLEQQKNGLELGRMLRQTIVDNSLLTPLSIICTKYLTEVEEFFWIAQFLMEVARWGGKNPSEKLQSVIFIDEADQYLPAQRKPPTKQPIENLLRRARSMGIGIMLGSQNPGDFDYRARDNILSWYLGRLTQKTGIDKVADFFSQSGHNVSALATQSQGEFHVVCEQKVKRIKAHRNLVSLPSQLGVDEIVQLAALGPCKASMLI